MDYPSINSTINKALFKKLTESIKCCYCGKPLSNQISSELTNVSYICIYGCEYNVAYLYSWKKYELIQESFGIREFRITNEFSTGKRCSYIADNDGEMVEFENVTINPLDNDSISHYIKLR